MSGFSAQLTVDVLSLISNKYAQSGYQDVVVGIELLNEPMAPSLNNDDLKAFIREGYNRVRKVSDTPVVVQDGFLAPSSYNGFLTSSDNGAYNVALDHHYYQVFDDNSVGLSQEQHIQAVCTSTSSFTGADKWTFVGEWTGAMTDCAKYLNGYGRGARYDGSYLGHAVVGSCAGISTISGWDQGMRNNTRRYIEAQMDAFEQNGQGWVWWNFKTEGAGEWDMLALLGTGVFPNPVTSRAFGQACQSYS